MIGQIIFNRLAAVLSSKSNRTLIILAFIMLANAISYGIIIPLQYLYAQKFGISATGLTWLMVCYSGAQFIATPIIGRLSDRFGRKPLLVLSILGTGIGMVMTAVAQSAGMLFMSRILDGLTGGNISVAQAAIADSTSGKDRAKSFGMLGAAFGFGFLFGPALGGWIGQFGLAAPFWLGALLAISASVAAAIFLPETLSPEMRQVGKFLDHPLIRWDALFKALVAPFSGILLLISLLVAAGQSSLIVGVQTASYDLYHFSSAKFGLVLSLVGVVGIVMQAGLLKRIIAWVKSKKVILTIALAGSGACLIVLAVARSESWFISFNLFYAVFMTVLAPVISGLLSQHTKEEDQGIILGINQSYIAMGTIVGPLLAGLFIVGNPEMVFWLSAGFLVAGLILSRWLYKSSPLIDV